jgi:hypothetical protein
MPGPARGERVSNLVQNRFANFRLVVQLDEMP